MKLVQNNEIMIFFLIITIEIYLLNVSAIVGSLHQELNSWMTSSSLARQLAGQAGRSIRS